MLGVQTSTSCPQQGSWCQSNSVIFLKLCWPPLLPFLPTLALSPFQDPAQLHCNYREAPSLFCPSWGGQAQGLMGFCKVPAREKPGSQLGGRWKVTPGGFREFPRAVFASSREPWPAARSSAWPQSLTTGWTQVTEGKANETEASAVIQEKIDNCCQKKVTNCDNWLALNVLVMGQRTQLNTYFILQISPFCHRTCIPLFLHHLVFYCTGALYSLLGSLVCSGGCKIKFWQNFPVSNSPPVSPGPLSTPRYPFVRCGTTPPCLPHIWVHPSAQVNGA